MKITFFRKGFASNSSSTHSIIWSETENKYVNRIYNNYEYGWEYFRLSSREEKQKYLFTTLLNNFNDVSYRLTKILKTVLDDNNNFLLFACKDNISVNSENFNINHYNFDSKIVKYLTCFDEKMINEFRDQLKSSDFGLFIDHQSLITLPLYHDFNLENDRIFDIEFFTELCKFILDDHISIFGGNDNDEHPTYNYGDTPPKNIQKIIDELVIEHSGSILLSKYDNKTKEYVLSDYLKGNITKIKF